VLREEKFNRLLQKYGNDDIKEEEIDEKEKQKIEEIRKKEEEERKRRKEAQDRCYMLYEKGKVKNEVSKLIFEKHHEMKVQSEMNYCTFKPKTNKKSEKMTANNIQKEIDGVMHKKSSQFYHKSVFWKSKKFEKLDEIRKGQKLGPEYVFKPNVFS
jgi:hypothetical protein